LKKGGGNRKEREGYEVIEQSLTINKRGKKMNLVNTQTNSKSQLFAGDFPRVLVPVSIVPGAGVLTAGTILGKIEKGATSKAVKNGGNTGDGTLTLDSITPILSGAQAGVYKIRVTRPAVAQVGTSPVVPAQKAVAKLEDPKGNVLEIFDVSTTPGVTITNHIKFTIVEGSAPFALGDGFDITIAAGSGKYKAYDDDETDGSETAVLILSEDIDASSTEVKTTAYASGHFNTAALTGLDDEAVNDFAGTAIFFGNVS